MKRFLLVLLVIMLCIPYASAESIDVSGMETEDLMDLYREIQIELASRVGLTESNQIGQGIYTVGKDIKAGTFSFICLESGEYDDGNQRNALYIYELEEDGISSGKTIWYLYDTSLNAPVTLSLSEGTIFEIWNCSGILTEIQPSWVP